jgi:tetratricopeptide (TPR) repeat protein
MAIAPLYLTVLRQGEMIVTDLSETDPVVPRSQVEIDESLLTEITDELTRIATLANKPNALGSLVPQGMVASSANSEQALQRLGALIFSHLFPTPTRQRLQEAASTDLFLRLDDQLVHVPWELAFEGQDFLLNKFRIGRQVITHWQPASQTISVSKDRNPLQMLIIVDPTESLPATEEEAEQLCHLLDTCDNLEVSVVSGKQVRKIDLLQELNEYDLVHFAGHACFEPTQPSRSGWILHDTVLTAAELRRLPQPPLLVFSNACRAGATTRWHTETVYDGQAFGIGSAFLLAGTRNYIGTFCPIHDAHSATFAADFYRHLLQGESIGAALTAARSRARQEAVTSGLLWASYMHYGNPTFHLPFLPMQDLAQSAHQHHAAGVHSASVISLPEFVQLPSEPHEIATAQQEHNSSPPQHCITREASVSVARETSDHTTRAVVNMRTSTARLVIGAVALLCAVIIVFLVGTWRGLWGASAVPVLITAYAALEHGDLDHASRLLQRLGETGGDSENSQHYAGLAAIAFAREDHQRGLEFIREAEKLDPQHAYSRVLVGQAAIALSRGDYGQALHFATKAKMADPAFAYSEVMYAHVLFNQKKFAEATAAYQRISSSPGIPSWLLTLVRQRLQQIATAQEEPKTP